MRSSVAACARGLDPRLKMALAMALGPGLWLLAPPLVALFGALLFVLLVSLSASQPLGSKMVRSMFVFVFIWVAIKVGLELWSDLPLTRVLMDAAILGLRLASLLMLGLCLALASSPRALGLALSWAIRPLVGAERAWKFALSLSLMVHFLPLTLAAMNHVKETLSRRCPDCRLRDRMRIIPQAILRNLGQKTWNQTLAVAGRGLEGGDAWQPDFTWTGRDTAVLVGAVLFAILILLLPN